MTTHFSIDYSTVSFHDDAVTESDGGERTIEWSVVDTVSVEDSPYEDAFGTDEFYEIDATVARPIPQPYVHDGDTYWFQKPEDELKAAAWSLGGAPWTMGHPQTGSVESATDVRGYWTDPRWSDDEKRLDSTLRLPVNDDEAKAFIEDNGDVSVGFYNRLEGADAYDGSVGHVDSAVYEATVDDVVAYQTAMHFDHVASVSVGRCSGEDGCGIDMDAHTHGSIETVDETPDSVTIESDGDGLSIEDLCSEGPCSCGRHRSSDEGPKQSEGLYGEHVDESDMDLSVPEGAQEAAQDFLDAVDEGKVPSECGGPDGLGRRRADMFAEGGDLSLEVWVTGGTSAVANWHARHEGNEDYDEDEVETPWEDCGYAMFKAWGGETARSKAMRLKEQHNEDINTDMNFQEGDEVRWMADAMVAHNPDDESGIMIEIMADGESTDMVTTVPMERLAHRGMEARDAKSEYSEGDTVEWDNGSAMGEVIDSKTDGCFNERIDGDVEVCAGDGTVYLIEEDDGATVAHKGSTLSMANDALASRVTQEQMTEGDDPLTSLNRRGSEEQTPDDDEESDKSLSGRSEDSFTERVLWASDDGEVAQNGAQNSESDVSADDGSLITEGGETSTETLQTDDVSVHEVEWSDTADKEWNEPSLNDFTDMEWSELDSDEKSSIADHYLVSKDGFPPGNFGDLSLPVVGADGTLVLNALQNAKARAGQVSGIGDDEQRVNGIIDRIANDNFDVTFGDNNDTIMDIDIDDLSAEAILDKVAADHDGVAERLNELNDYEAASEAADEAASELDIDSVEELGDAVSVLDEQKAELEDKVEDLESTIDELKRPEMEDDAAFIAERTERFGEDAESVIDHFDEDADAIAEKREMVEDLTESYDEQTANADGVDSGKTGPSVQTDGKYARTPWE
jgi:hypothetical protein